MMRLREKSSQSRAIYSLVLRSSSETVAKQLEKNRRFVSYNKNKEIK